MAKVIKKKYLSRFYAIFNYVKTAVKV